MHHIKNGRAAFEKFAELFLGFGNGVLLDQYRPQWSLSVKLGFRHNSIFHQNWFNSLGMTYAGG